MPDIIKRTTLIVRDAEASAHWYATVFGMARWMDQPFTLSGMQLAAGSRGDQTRLVIMRGDHAQLGMIGLLEWLDPPFPAPPVLPERITFGWPIFVVAAEDAAATCERARALGSRIHCEPHRWTVLDSEGREQPLVGTSFFDLDGYFFEVNQRVAA
jgi:catechol 2,3-dioxygenase-like lactoylglutathione lyase family enzyme